MWKALCIHGPGWLWSLLKVRVSQPSTIVFWAGQLVVGAVPWTVGCWAHPYCLSHPSHDDQECPRHCQVFPWDNIAPYFLFPHLRTTAVGWAVWAFSLGNLVLPLALVMFPRKESSTLLPERVLLGSTVLSPCVRYVQRGPVSSHPGNPLFYTFLEINLSAFCQGWGEHYDRERYLGCNCFTSRLSTHPLFVAPLSTPFQNTLCELPHL